MSVTVPRIPRLLLQAALPADFRTEVLDDLEAEFTLRPLKTRRLWYWSQAIRSTWHLGVLELEKSEWQAGLLSVLAAGAGPVLLLDFLWSRVLSAIPLKAGLERGLDFTLAVLIVTAVACAGTGGRRRGGVALAATALLGWTFAALGTLASRGILPDW
jgi:hypothetical protein